MESWRPRVLEARRKLQLALERVNTSQSHKQLIPSKESTSGQL
jgi:hypothetical protein